MSVRPHCTFCSGLSVGRYYLAGGCQAYPDVHEQELCAQHLVSVEPLGGPMELLALHAPEVERMILGPRS